MSRSDQPRVYGAPDPDDQPPPTGEGLWGEQKAAKPMRADLAHGATTPDGDRITIEEQSGTAFAEATGKASGTDPDDSEAH